MENTGFDLLRALNYGLIPSIYFSNLPEEDIGSYIGQYLTEEIAQEGLTRNVPAFARFLHVAATVNGQLLNYEDVANDAQLSRQTVHNWFQILYDTLVGYELEPLTATKKRKAINTAKFYFFDMGVARFLKRLPAVTPKNKDFGDLFEHYIFHEIKSWKDYKFPSYRLNFWRSKSNFEVDFVINEEITVEVKSTDRVLDKHLRIRA